MDIKLVNKISNMTITGYYDASSKLVVAWFFNSDGDKADLVAYLNPSMSWDLREVISETSVITDDRETVEILHKSLGLHAPGSDIDNILRKSLAALIEGFEDEGVDSPETQLMKNVLEQSSYTQLKNLN